MLQEDNDITFVLLCIGVLWTTNEPCLCSLTRTLTYSVNHVYRWWCANLEPSCLEAAVLAIPFICFPLFPLYKNGVAKKFLESSYIKIKYLIWEEQHGLMPSPSTDLHFTNQFKRFCISLRTKVCMASYLFRNYNFLKYPKKKNFSIQLWTLNGVLLFLQINV